MNIFKSDSPIFRSLLYSRTDVYRAVVTANDFWLTPPRDDLFELPKQQLCGRGEVNLHANGLMVEIVNNIEQSTCSAILGLVVHDVHRPHLVDCLRRRQDFRLFTHNPFTRLDPYI